MMATLQRQVQSAAWPSQCCAKRGEGDVAATAGLFPDPGLAGCAGGYGGQFLAGHQRWGTAAKRGSDVRRGETDLVSTARARGARYKYKKNKTPNHKNQCK